MPAQSFNALALAALDIGAFGFMRIYERSGRFLAPGLVLADSARADRLLEGVRTLQRNSVREGIDAELIGIGHAAIQRAKTGNALTRVDRLLLELTSDDEAATEAVVARGLAVDRVSNAETIANLMVRVELVDQRLVVSRLTISGGAPRDEDDVRARAAATILWAHLTGTTDAGPLSVGDPGAFLAQLKEQGVSVKRSFRGELMRSGGG